MTVSRKPSQPATEMASTPETSDGYPQSQESTVESSHPTQDPRLSIGGTRTRRDTNQEESFYRLNRIGADTGELPSTTNNGQAPMRYRPSSSGQSSFLAPESSANPRRSRTRFSANRYVPSNLSKTPTHPPNITAAEHTKATTSGPPRPRSYRRPSVSPGPDTGPSLTPDPSNPASTNSQSKWCAFQSPKGRPFEFPREYHVRGVAFAALSEAASSAGSGQFPDPETFASEGKVDRIFCCGPGNTGARFEYTGGNPNGSKQTTMLDLFVRNVAGREQPWEMEQRLTTERVSDDGRREITHHFGDKTSHGRFFPLKSSAAEILSEELWPKIPRDLSDGSDTND